MTATAWIALLWLAFAATHIGLTTTRVRAKTVERLGPHGHRGLFSVVAFAIAIPAVMLYIRNHNSGPQLWETPEGAAAWLLWAGMVTGVGLIVLSIVQPSPTMMTGSRRMEVRGVLRVSRHPMLVGTALIGICQALLGGFATDVAFYGGLAAYSVAGGLHQDRRYLREDVPGYRAFYEATSFFPFWPKGRAGSPRSNGPHPSGGATAAG